MGTVSPWSVKGVEPDAREAAKAAAHRAGMTLGQWLSATIRTAAAAPPADDSPSRAPDLGTARDSLSVRESQAAAERAEALTELSETSMEQALQRLTARLAKPDSTDGPTGGDRRWSASDRPTDGA